MGFIKSEIPVEIYSLIFFIRSADDYLRVKKVNGELIWLTYEAGFEPDIVELLRLCYWYYKCSSLSFISLNYKKIELRKQLGTELPEKVKEHFSEDPSRFSMELLKELTIIKNTHEPGGGFYYFDILEKVSSYVSELMVMFLVVKDKFKARFVKNTDIESSENKKKFDMPVENIPSEVKSSSTYDCWIFRYGFVSS